MSNKKANDAAIKYLNEQHLPTHVEYSAFIAGFNWTKKEFIEQASDWLKEHIWEYVKSHGEFDYEVLDGLDEDGLVEDFRKAMEEE